MIGLLIAYFIFLFRDPNRLQSEEYLLQHEAMQTIWRRGSDQPLEVDQSEITTQSEALKRIGTDRRKFSTMPEIIDWLWFFGNSAVVKTYGDAGGIGRAFHGQFPGLQFIVTEVSPSKSEGWLPQMVWNFINQSVEQKIAS